MILIIRRYAKLIGFAFVIFMWGCIELKQEIPQFHYFILQYDPPEPAQIKPLDATLTVRRFQCNVLYDTDRMIIQKDSFEQQYDPFNRWAVGPGQMVSQLIERDIRSSGLVRFVQFGRNQLVANYELVGVIEKFFGFENNKERMAIVKLRAMLLKTNSLGTPQKVVFDNVYSTKKPIKGQGARGLATAMSSGVKEISMRIMDDLLRALQ